MAIFGFGAIGRAVAGPLVRNELAGIELIGIVTRTAPDTLEEGIRLFATPDEALSHRPRIVVEAAGGKAFADLVPQCLARGVDVLAVSVAAMADRAVEAAVREASAAGGGRLLVASGAVAGLDAISAAREGGLTRVSLVQRKPLRAFPDLDQSASEATTVSQGSARDAALAFPQNANISAAIALAGLGLDATEVSVVADPSVSRNIAELRVEGAFGELDVTIRNLPSAANPRTARLASLSILAALRRSTAPIVVPA